MSDYTSLMAMMGKGVVESTKLMVRGANNLLQSVTKNTPEHRNMKRRGITEYQPSEIGGFFPLDEIADQMVVSGGNDKIRAEAIEAYVQLALYRQTPVIILHNGDRILEQYMMTILGSTGLLGLVNSMNKKYEPFVGKDSRTIGQMICESAPKDLEIKANIRSYIEGMCRFLQSRKAVPTYQMLSTCPHGQMIFKVDEAVMNGRLSQTRGQEIKMRLIAGQNEYYKIENYFYDLNMQIDPILWRYNKGNKEKPVNIFSALKQKGVLMVDVGSSSNQMLINLLLSELRIALQQGHQMACVLSGIDISDNEYLQHMLEQSSGKCKMAVISRDVYTSCNADERLFHLLLGKSMKNIIFTHSSNVSATKWAEGIGSYDKEETSYSYSQGKSRSPTQFFATTSSNQSKSISIKREYIVKPEEILRMEEREAYIYTKVTNELAHTMLV